MSAYSIQAKYEKARSVNTISSSFVAVGDPLEHSARILRYVNATSSTVFISTDGVNVHDVMFPNSQLTINVGTNRGSVSSEFLFPQGTQFYVSGNPGSGVFAIISIYAI